MAHFAEINQSNVVLRVIVIANNDICDKNGNEIEQIGIDLCNRVFGGNWVQTSYNARFRGSFASIGCFYDPIQDIFYADPLTVSIPEQEE